MTVTKTTYAQVKPFIQDFKSKFPDPKSLAKILDLGPLDGSKSAAEKSVYDACVSVMRMAEMAELAAVEQALSAENPNQADLMSIQHQIQTMNVKKEMVRAINKKVEDSEEATAQRP